MKENHEARKRLIAAVRAFVAFASLLILGGCAATPSYPGVYVEEVPSGVHPIEGVPTSVTAFVGITSLGPYNTPEQISSYSEFRRSFTAVNMPDPLVSAVHDFFSNGGTRAVIVRAEDDPGYENAINALDSVDLFNLLCILPRVPGQDVPPTVWNIALQSCVKHRAVLIVDPPLHWRTPKDIEPGEFGLGSESSGNASVYFPRIVEMREGRSDTVAPSGAVAGVIARTDAQKGVWQSPAGTHATVTGADGCAFSLSEADVPSLNERGINSIRHFPERGCLIWGARTAAGGDNSSSDWKYLSVRRLSLYIEESVYRGTLWVVFEPNDESLWSQIRTNVSAFMHTLWHNGGLRGQKADQAYFVKCDATTTSQADRDRGVVNILVGFAPVKPAEFVILKIQQPAGPSSVK
jgi:hypothetical protein